MAKNLKIENAKILFPNFSGAEKAFNPKGRRNFCVLIDPEIAGTLSDVGWNIKMLKPREEGDEPLPYLQVAVSFEHKPPKVVLITSGGQTILNEDNIGGLDWADIEIADIVVSPYAWSVSGKSGVKAYLKTAYITLAEDDIEKKYSRDIATAVGE